MSPHEDGSNATRGASVQERDLMALADGRIAPDSEHAARIREYLQADPNAAARFASWQQQNAAIRAHYAPALAEPVPERLQPETLRARRHQAQGRRRASGGGGGRCGRGGGGGDAPGGRPPGATRTQRWIALPARSRSCPRTPIQRRCRRPCLRPRWPRVTSTPCPISARWAMPSRGNAASTPETAPRPKPVMRTLKGVPCDSSSRRKAMASPPHLHRRVENGRQIAYWRVGQRLYALASQTQLQPGRLQRIAGATRVDRGFGQAPSGTALAADQGRDVQPPPQGAPLVTMEEAPARSETAPARPASVHYEGMVKDSSL